MMTGVCFYLFPIKKREISWEISLFLYSISIPGTFLSKEARLQHQA